MAKKALLSAPQVEASESSIQNVLIEGNNTLLQGSTLQTEEPIQVAVPKKNKFLLPSKEFSVSENPEMMNEEPDTSFITSFPSDVDIVYVPNIKPILKKSAEKPIKLDGGIRVPKPFLPCDLPTNCDMGGESQMGGGNGGGGGNTTINNTTIINNSTIGDDKINLKWHVDGNIFFGDSNDPMGIIYSHGRIFIHNFYPLSDEEIEAMGRENYHPERSWYVRGNIDDEVYFILPDYDIHYIFIDIPIAEGMTDAEVFITKSYNHEELKEGYVHILTGMINHVGKHLVLSMICGNDTKITVPPPPPPPIPGKRWIIDSVLCVKANGVNTGMQTTTSHREVEDLATGKWVLDTSPGSTNSVTTSNLTACPVPGTKYRWTRDETKDYCEEESGGEGYNTGTRFLYSFEESSYNDGPWIKTGNTKYVPTTNYTLCPLTPYRVSMSTGPDGGYNFNNEKLIEYSPGTMIALEAPIYHDEENWDFFYLSIPKDKTFIVTDSIGNNIRAEFSQVGTDNRPGFRKNYTWKKADAYATDFVGMFGLKIN